MSWIKLGFQQCPERINLANVTRIEYSYTDHYIFWWVDGTQQSRYITSEQMAEIDQLIFKQTNEVP